MRFLGSNLTLTGDQTINLAMFVGDLNYYLSEEGVDTAPMQVVTVSGKEPVIPPRFRFYIGKLDELEESPHVLEFEKADPTKFLDEWSDPHSGIARQIWLIKAISGSWEWYEWHGAPDTPPLENRGTAENLIQLAAKVRKFQSQYSPTPE